MVSEREVVGLLYRADWTKLTLSGTVTGAEPVVDTVITVQSDEPPRGPWQREDDDTEPPPPPPSWLFPHVPPWAVPAGRSASAGGAPRAGFRPVLGLRAGTARAPYAPCPSRRDGGSGPMARTGPGRSAATGRGCGTGSVSARRAPPSASALTESMTGRGRRTGPCSRRPGCWPGTRWYSTARRRWPGGPGYGCAVRTGPVAAQTTRIGGRLGRSVGAGGLFAPIPRWMGLGQGRGGGGRRHRARHPAALLAAISRRAAPGDRVPDGRRGRPGRRLAVHRPAGERVRRRPGRLGPGARATGRPARRAGRSGTPSAKRLRRRARRPRRPSPGWRPAGWAR